MPQLNTQETRYIIAQAVTLVSSIALSYFQRTLLYITTSLVVLCLAHGPLLTAIFLLFTLLNFTLFVAFRRHKRVSLYLTAFNIAVIALHRLYTHRIRTLFGTNDLSAPLMLLTIKMYYVAQHLDFNTHSVEELLEYLFYTPALMFGPVTPFLSFTKRTKTHKTQAHGVVKLAECLVYLGLYVGLRDRYAPDKLAGTLPSTVFSMYMYGLCCRCKYYFAWTFSYACCLLNSYPGTKNVHPLAFECSTSLQSLTRTWNIYTNLWLKESIFQRLKSRSLFAASMATFLVSALWHGIQPYFLVMFATFGLSIPIMKSNVLIAKKYGSLCAQLFGLFQTALFVSYFSLPFLVESIGKSLVVWRAVYFYGHVYLALSAVNHYFLLGRYY